LDIDKTNQNSDLASDDWIGYSGKLVVNRNNVQAVPINGKCPKGSNSATITGAITLTVPCDKNNKFDVNVDMSDVNDGSYHLTVSFDTGKMVEFEMLVDTTEPTVKSVLSQSPDGLYSAGDQIEIKIVFSEPVEVSGGNPLIQLNTLPTVRSAHYTSGSGSANLIFTYTVQPGDEAPLLNYNGSTSMDLQNANIQDLVANQLLAVLPNPGWGYSLGDLSNLIISNSLPGNFQILGVIGGTDVSLDGYLTDAGFPTVQLGSSPRTKTYLAEIWNLGMTNKICGPNSGTSTTIVMTNCNLSEGGYKIVGSALNSIGQKVAENNEFPFIVKTDIVIAEVSGVPVGSTNVTNLNFIVSGPASLTKYKYKLGLATLDCTSSSGYSIEFAKATEIVASLSGFSDGTLKLCIIGNDGSPFWQPYALATERTWTKDTQNPNLSITPPTNNSLLNTLNIANFTVSGTCTENNLPITVTLDGNTDIASTTCQSGLFSSLIDTTTLPEGNFTLTATIADLAGNAQTSPDVTLIRDTVVPMISSLSSSTPNGVYNSGDISIALTFSQPVVVTGIPELALNIFPTIRKAYYQGGSGTAILTFKYSVVTGDNSSGLDYASLSSLSANAGSIKDTSQNSASLILPLAPNNLSTTHFLVIDTTAPILAISSPSDGFIVSGLNNAVNFPVSGTCSENGSTVIIEIDGNVNSAGGACGGGIFTGSFDSTGLANGTHSLVAKLTDVAGNLGFSSTQTFTKSTVGPTIGITTPSNNSFINQLSNSATYLISGNCSEDGQAVSVFVDSVLAGAGGTCTTGAFSASIDTNALAAGTHVITAKITDTLANTTTSGPRNVTKDVVAPSIVIAAPVQGSFINLISNSTSFSISGTCSELNQAIIFKIDGVAAGTGAICDGTNFTGSFDATLLTSGSHSLSATISDIAGNATGSIAVTLEKDLTPPTIAISSPVNNSYINGLLDSTTFLITGTCSESGRSVTVQVVSSSISAVDTCNAGNYSVTIDSTLLAAGNYTLEASLSDAAGNLASTSIAVTKDVSFPALAISSPLDNSYLNTTANTINYSISGTCSEESQTVELLIDGLLNISNGACNLGAFNILIDATVLSENTHALRVRSSDGAGNVGLSAAINIIKDVTSPTLEPTFRT
jgi:hypothetical protein